MTGVAAPPARAAIYARFSSDNQSENSIEDQVRICRARAEREHWDIVEVYADYAISGATADRPRFQALLVDARTGRFDLVIAEASDRLSRDQEHIAGFYKQLSFVGVHLVTLADGEINELHVGLKGTMAALWLKDLAQKTHRGIEGRVRAGRSGGGLSFGYRVPRRVRPDGTIAAGEMEIVAEEAAVIRRIFTDYASGLSPRTIARALNRDGVPGPRGGQWTASLILGNAVREIGLLRNRLYAGERVWNRQHFIKDPNTGRRVSRPNPKEAWVITPVPTLRIIEEPPVEHSPDPPSGGSSCRRRSRGAGSKPKCRVPPVRRSSRCGATSPVAVVRPGALRCVQRPDGYRFERRETSLQQPA